MDFVVLTRLEKSSRKVVIVVAIVAITFHLPLKRIDTGRKTNYSHVKKK